MENKNLFFEIIKSGFDFILFLIKVLFRKIMSLFDKVFKKFQALPENTQKRVKSSFIIAIIFSIIVLFGGIAYILLISACCCVMLYELLAMLSKIKNTNNKTFISLRRFGILYILICCISLILIRVQMSQGLKATIWLFLACWGTDCGAFVFGKKYGKIKLAPTISKSKTYEGAIFGAITGFVISFLLYKLFKSYNSGFFHFISFMIISAIVVILAQLGDLSESVIKRQCDVKDSGNIIPGHGGMFDRFDSLLIVAPFIYIVLLFTNGVLF